jgi:hypothetical protein
MILSSSNYFKVVSKIRYHIVRDDQIGNALVDWNVYEYLISGEPVSSSLEYFFSPDPQPEVHFRMSLLGQRPYPK